MPNSIVIRNKITLKLPSEEHCSLEHHIQDIAAQIISLRNRYLSYATLLAVAIVPNVCDVFLSVFALVFLCSFPLLPILALCRLVWPNNLNVGRLTKLYSQLICR